MVAYTPKWKSTHCPPERKMLNSATGDTMQYKADTDMERKIISEYADHIPLSHLFAKEMDDVQLVPFMFNISRKPFK